MNMHNACFRLILSTHDLMFILHFCSFSVTHLAKSSNFSRSRHTHPNDRSRSLQTIEHISFISIIYWKTQWPRPGLQNRRHILPRRRPRKSHQRLRMSSPGRSHIRWNILTRSRHLLLPPLNYIIPPRTCCRRYGVL